MMTAARVTAIALLTAAPLLASAQGWPPKPWPSVQVSIVVSSAPGGTADKMARILADRFTDRLGRSFIVENYRDTHGVVRTDISTEIVALRHAGYWLLLTSASLAVNTTLRAWKGNFDPVRHLAPVIWLSSVPLVLTVHPTVPAQNVRELVELSKRDKSGLHAGHNGTATTSRIALDMLVRHTGAKIHPIAHTGGGPTTLALVGGQLDLAFSTLTTVKPHIDARRLRAIAVTTREPSRVLPKLPTMSSIYPDFEVDNWFGIFVAGGTEKDIIAKLHGLAAEALKLPELHDFIVKNGGDVIGGTPEALGAHFRNELARYARVMNPGTEAK